LPRSVHSSEISPVITLAQALKRAATQLHMHDQPALDAEVLLAHVLNRSRAYLHAWPEAELGPEQESEFFDLIRLRAEGQPVAYLTGRREFWSLDLEVSADALIPRPETELLVERTLAVLPDNEPLRIADLGTGSGAIAIALAHERRAWQVYAIDRSQACIKLAQRNARRLGADNLCCIRADWSEALAEQSFHAIVANPPYIADEDPHLRRGDVRFEPVSALTSGPDGLDDLARLVADAPRVLKPAGWLLLEHAMDQAPAIRRLLNNISFKDISTARDLAGLERVSCARKPA
jgi:release factor glutamine methyltransferase